MRIALPIVLLGVLSLPPFYPAQAMQAVDVVDGHTVTVQVSARELTRIGMAGEGRIVRVWGLEERMNVEADTEGGQVFIRPTQSGKPRPFSLFVKDDRGATYTLVAIPVDMPSDAVILHPKQAMGPAGLGQSAAAYVARLKYLVRAMAKGLEPEGYTPVKVDKPVPLWDGTRLVLLRRWMGELVGEVYRLTNVSATEKDLDERGFGVLEKNILAVAIEQRTLAPGESTSIYLVRKTP